MYGNYVPPFRRTHASGETPDAPQSGDQPSNPGRHDDSRRGRGNRGGRGGDRGDRGDRGGRGGDRGGRGRGRGRGRGFNNNNFSQGNNRQQQGQEQAVENEELYQLHDIDNYFLGREESTLQGHSTTFHDSKKNPGQLSHLLLFVGANPRWVSDRIVFAKSSLHLLPEYAAKKAEHGEWQTPEAPKDDAKTEAQSPDGTSDDVTKEEAAPQSAVQSEGSSPDAAAPSASASEKEEEKPKEEAAPSETTKEDAEHALETAPVPEPEPAPKTSFGSRMNTTDIRNLPPDEYQRLEEEQQRQRQEQRQAQQLAQAPTFPAIQPIDYVPDQQASLVVAVFEQRRWQNGVSGGFVFVGWHRVARVNILAPRSAELVRMQQQKWERRGRRGHAPPVRDAAAWNAALGTEWAVVKFEKLGDDAPPAPAIKKTMPEPAQKGEEGQGGSDAKTEVKAEAEAKTETETQAESKAVEEKLEKMSIQEDVKTVEGDKEGSTDAVKQQENAEQEPKAEGEAKTSERVEAKEKENVPLA
ncbi:hypothetical protein F4818DRAFT_402826 [Hypoxylon cercidicola]|nr:hypothetical protein F4818DRAFT_402826 [Hypoxylon cercidicola]